MLMFYKLKCQNTKNCNTHAIIQMDLFFELYFFSFFCLENKRISTFLLAVRHIASYVMILCD
jgi:hypothetical protein